MLINSVCRVFLLTVLFCSQPILASNFDHQHQDWGALLSSYVVDAGSSSEVHYAELRKNRAQLERYLTQLSAVSKVEFGRWQSAQKLAFLINAYNAFTLKLIIDHYPSRVNQGHR